MLNKYLLSDKWGKRHKMQWIPRFPGNCQLNGHVVVTGWGRRYFWGCRRAEFLTAKTIQSLKFNPFHSLLLFPAVNENHQENKKMATCQCPWERVNNCMYYVAYKEERGKHTQVLGSRLPCLYLPRSVLNLGHLDMESGFCLRWLPLQF